MTDTNTVEQFLRTTFSRAAEYRDRPSGITAALPLLENALTGNIEQEDEKRKLVDVGKSAVQHAIYRILDDRFDQYDYDQVSLIAKRYTVPLQLYKQIGKQIHLKQYVKPADHKETLEIIILARCCGFMAVYKFIEEEFVSLFTQDINKANRPREPNPPSPLTDQDGSPSQLLNEVVQAKSGEVKTEEQEMEGGKWQANIVAKLSEKAPSFSHARTSASKKKAKAEASRDILTYFDSNKDVYERLQVPVEGEADIYVLPIRQNDYCHLFTEKTTSTTTSTTTAAATTSTSTTTANTPTTSTTATNTATTNTATTTNPHALNTGDWSGVSVKRERSSPELDAPPQAKVFFS
ncbi:hypothetical protein FB192DRAFT_1475229 [Mucor lusitanicus]|uniref:RNase III domain-containing protein n=1 Tax=Mucor circinelloides f. lusitanicus TaxID=29924 RepID=A0A8H4BDM0_MUCCL|nr:hypothetical protein FB192DRAFT_1475229 [Mucor lusitanicus]